MRRPRVPVELAERIDGVRGDVPFERWVRRALEAYLDEAEMAALPALSLAETVVVQREANAVRSRMIEGKHLLATDPARDAAMARQAALNKSKGL